MKNLARALFVTTLLAATPALAQPAAPATVAGTPVPAPAVPADIAQRVEVARKIHALRPATQEIEDAADRAAQRIPAANRADFKQKFIADVDAKRMDEVSINAMAQTFTLPELQKMFDYFSSPEAKSIADKWPIYEQLIQPEITKMMDKAIMDAKVGSAAPASPFTTQQAAPSGAVPMNLPHSASPTTH